MRFILCCLILLLSASPSLAAPGIILFGEQKYKPGFAHFDYVNPDAPQGGKVRLSTTVTFDSLNPFILKGVAAPGMALSLETLMTQSLDEPQSFYPLIANDIYVAPDRTYADFTLNPDARWHDGEPITADDVVFTFEILTTKGHPSFRILYQPISKVEKLSTLRVRFHFSDPTNRELPVVAAGMNVLPKHYYATRPFDQTTLEPPLGSGPYKVSAVDQGRSVTFTRVRDYWGNKLPVNVGYYNFDEIRYDVYRDETVAVEAFKSGQYDFREEYIARIWATAYDFPAVTKGDVIKTKIPHKVPSGMQAFMFNTRLDKFADARVREAIGLTMDFEWMNETLFYGAYTRSQSFFQNTNLMQSGIPEGHELKLLEPFRAELTPALFSEPFVLPTTDGSGYPRENLIKAQQLLNDAGWVMKDGKRVSEKTGERLTIEFLMRQRTFERVVGGMIRNLDKLGIDAVFRYIDDSQYQKRLDDRDYDIISIWWNREVFFPGNEQLNFWHSSQADVAGSMNYSGIKSPAVDALLAKLTQARTLQELTDSGRALDRVLLWGHYVIPHWYIGAWRIIYWDKFGRPEIAPSYDMGLTTWWSKSAEQKQ